MKLQLLASAIILAFFFQPEISSRVKNGIPLLDSLILKEDFASAKKELDRQMAVLEKEANIDSLALYAYYVGRLNDETTGRASAIQILNGFVQKMESKNLSLEALVDLYSKTAVYYDYIRDYEKNLAFHLKALEHAEKFRNKNNLPLAKVYYNLSVSSNRKGNFSDVKMYAQKSLTEYRKNKNAGFEDLYFANSALGNACYYSSEIDSAIYFYEQAQRYASMDTVSPYNRYYRPSLLANNISVLYLMLGQNRKAMEKMQFAIDNNQKFIETGTDAFKVEESKKWQLSYIENLAGLYEGKGDYKTQAELLKYTLYKRLADPKTEDLELGITHTLNGEAQLNLLNLNEAESHFLKALEILKKENGGLEWLATAYSGLGNIYREKKENYKAENHFLEAVAIYREMNPHDRDKTQIEFLNDLALFYAETGEKEKALKTADDNLKYITERVSEDGLPLINQQYIIGEINFLNGDYRKAEILADSSLNAMNRLIRESSNSFDSANLEFKKVSFSLLKIRSAYENDPVRNESSLMPLLNRNLAIIDLINNQKQYLYSEENIQILIENNRKVYDFAKKLMLELYEKTGDKKYLLKTVELHENSLYNRIRNHLNRVDEFSGPGVPASVTRRESQLKADLNKGIELDSVDIYVKAQNEWGTFLDSLKTGYRKYYNLRYADPGISLTEVQNKIPENTTVIRYFFIGNELNAVVLSKKTAELRKLNTTDINQQIHRVQDFNSAEENVFSDLHSLYNKLWKPLEALVKTEEVIIIPDGELFNLSFETLTPNKIQSYNKLAHHSLLARHAVSYSFSSFLLNDATGSVNSKNDLVAFAPGFSKELKSVYAKKISDSVNLDRNYLNLLPQPGAVELVKKFNAKFRGKFFLNEKASRKSFTENAGNSRVIHIATHAESNNLSPELSSLVFAKDAAAEDRNENYLYSYQIYDQNLASDMAVLSACETGKPQKNPGEGMISMAHAFSYAGCKSIVTGLWKMDEKSTSQILEHFYSHLQAGTSKNKALQLAKLDYLAHAKGNTASPAYWSGLVLMGDTSEIEFSSPIPVFWIIAGAAILLAVIFLLYRKFNKS